MGCNRTSNSFKHEREFSTWQTQNFKSVRKDGSFETHPYLGSHLERKKRIRLELYLTPRTKINSKRVRDFEGENWNHKVLTINSRNFFINLRWELPKQDTKYKNTQIHTKNCFDHFKYTKLKKKILEIKFLHSKSHTKQLGENICKLCQRACFYHM